MDGSEMKQSLHRRLQSAREAVLSELDGLSEYDLRRPMTPSATNLLGVVKHLGGVEYGYLGETFGRPCPEPWLKGQDLEELAAARAEGFLSGCLSGDMWARPEESSEEIIGFYRRACAHGDATIAALDLGAVGSIPHYPEGQRATTLGDILGLMISETNRQTGQLDVVRELIDGRLSDGSNALGSDEQWAEYVAHVEAAADEAAPPR